MMLKSTPNAQRRVSGLGSLSVSGLIDIATLSARPWVVAALMLSALGTIPIFGAPSDSVSETDAPDAISGATGLAEAPFLSENDAVMTKMMNDMAVAPTGDVDRDFVAMMVPHHQGAIDMAKLVLRYGKNEQLRRLAQEIIVTQQQEIVAMRLAAGEPLVEAATSAPSTSFQSTAADTPAPDLLQKQETP